jgi:hypothetical protein
MQYETHIQDDMSSIGEDSDTDLWADVDRRNRRLRVSSIGSVTSTCKTEVSLPGRDLQVERRDWDHSKSEVPRHITGGPSLSNRGFNSESSIDVTDCCPRGKNGSNMYVLAPIALPMGRMPRRRSRSSHARLSQSLPRDDESHIPHGSNHSARSGIGGTYSCEITAPTYAPPVRGLRRNTMTHVSSSEITDPCERAPPMERMQRPPSVSSQARLSQSRPRSDVSHLPHESNHSARSGLGGTYSCEITAPTYAPPVRGLRRHTMAHVSSSEITAPCERAPPMERVQRPPSASSQARLPQSHPRGDVSHLPHGSNHSAHSGLGGTYSNEVTAPTGAQPGCGLRRNNMTSAQIRTYEKIERYKALQGQSTTGTIPVDSQPFPTFQTHPHLLTPLHGESNTLDNRCDLRRQNDIGNADTAWCPRRDLSTKDDLIVNFRKKSSPAEKLQEQTKRVIRAFSLGVSNVMNGSNHGELRDTAWASQSRSSRSLDDPETVTTKGRSRSSSNPARRNKRLAQPPNHLIHRS